MKKYFFCLFAFLPLSVIAQHWVWQNPLPQGNGLRDIYFMDRENGWAVGDGGLILRTSNGGDLWEIHPSGTEASLQNIAFVDSETAWIVGSGGTILKTIDGGGRWTPQYTGSTQALYGVHFVDNRRGWVAGSEGIILRTKDGGSNWEVQVSNTSEWLYDIFFLDANMGWAVGGGGTILKTSNGGEDWEPQNSNATTRLYSIYFKDADTGWAVGNRTFANILQTTDGGNTWTAQPGVDDALTDIYFTDSNTGWAVGSSQRIIKSTDGGNTWESLHENIISEWLQSIYMVDDNTGWAVGYFGSILKTTDGGINWRHQDLGSTAYLSSIFFTDSNTGWAAGTGFNREILKTVDGGNNWEVYSSDASTRVNSIFFIDPDIGWMVGSNGVILKTVDGGDHWETQVSQTAKTLYDVFFTDPQTGWAAGEAGTFLKTTDGGERWENRSFNTPLSFLNTFFIDSELGWIVGSGGFIIKITEGGAQWEVQTSRTNASLNSVYFANEKVGWIAGGRGTIQMTTNGGNTWRLRVTPTSMGLSDIFFIDAKMGWAAGGGGTLLKTTNGGYNWELQSSGATTGLQSVYFTDQFSGWAAGDRGTILHYEPPCRLRDSTILVDLYRSTQGWSWVESWNLYQPLDQWYGVVLNEDGCVTGLNLADNQLDGKISELINFMEDLTSLNLQGNDLTDLPDIQIDKLSDLRVNDNDLTYKDILPNLEHFSDSSDYMPQKTPINEASCGFRDSIALLVLRRDADGDNWRQAWDLKEPIERWRGVKRNEEGCVVELDLSGNSLKGQAPLAVNFIKKLRYLDLSDNELTGLPKLRLDSLSQLFVSKNSLTFEDLLPNAAYFFTPEDYAPQDTLPALSFTFEPCDSAFVIESLVDEQIDFKSFDWRKGEEWLTLGDNRLSLEDFYGLEYNDYGGSYGFSITHPALALKLYGEIAVATTECVNTTTYIDDILCIDADVVINEKLYNVNNPKDCRLNRSQTDTSCIANRTLIDLQFGEPDTMFVRDTLYWGETVQVCNQIVDCSAYNQVLECYNPETGCVSPFKIQFYCLEEPENPISIPSAFTPNGDGVNDYFVIPFLIEAPEKYQKNQLRVFNRYKQLVYEIQAYRQDFETLWDGADQLGRPLPAGTYFYVFTYADVQSITGTVTIVR